MSKGYLLGPDFELEQLIDHLEGKFEFKQENAQSSDFALYDSFDWRLYRRGYSLNRLGDRLILRSLSDGVEMNSTISNTEPSFVWALPQSTIQKKLAPILEMRKLLEQASGGSRSIILRILNTDRKTVARLLFDERSCDTPGNEPAYLRAIWVKPVRGYPRYSLMLEKLFEKTGFGEFQYVDGYRACLAAAGIEPGDYSAQLNEVRLQPEMRSDEATRVILRFTLRVMRRNEAGILADVDTEFLHDYRVAVRRTRSALMQIREVFPAHLVAYFKGEFAKLGRLTSPLRDLDVYLLNEEAFRRMLPPVLRAGIDPLFEHLKEQRKRALKDVGVELKSEKYDTLLSKWDFYLAQPAPEEMDPTAQNAGKPVIELACERIAKRYRRVIREGESILEAEIVDDDKLHELRIDCKKLRYLLEFFASLFPKEDIKALVRQLKRLQDNLGDFNDYCNQCDYLLHISHEIPLDAESSRATIASIGCLVGILEQEKVRVRGDFAETFLEFASKMNQKRVKILTSEGSA